MAQTVWNIVFRALVSHELGVPMSAPDLLTVSSRFPRKAKSGHDPLNIGLALRASRIWGVGSGILLPKP